MSARFVVYYRVSTPKQGESGLGLDAQRRDVATFLANRPESTVVGEFQEIECGANDDRPALAQAMALATVTGAKLLVAKQDRLSRDVHFLTGLSKRGVEFVAADNPDAPELTTNVLASVAQEERKLIARRTKAALASINAKLEAGEQHVSKAGRVVVRLGNPRGLTVMRPDLGTAAKVAKADAFAQAVGKKVSDLKAEGMSLRQIAQALEANSFLAPNRKSTKWTPMAVKRVLDRVAQTVAGGIVE